MEAEPLDHQAGVEGRVDQVDRLAGAAPNLEESSTIAPVLGTRIRSASPACGDSGGSCAISVHVVVGHQRLVRVEFLQRLVRLDGVGVDDLVPDEVLPRLGRQRLDVLVDDKELGHRGHVEAGPGLVERLDDRRVGVGLHGVVGLHAGQQPLEAGIVLPQDAWSTTNSGVPCSLARRRNLAGASTLLGRGSSDRITIPTLPLTSPRRKNS